MVVPPTKVKLLGIAGNVAWKKPSAPMFTTAKGGPKPGASSTFSPGSRPRTNPVKSNCNACEGEGGEMDALVTGEGGTSSWTYCSAPPQADTFPAVSTARAENRFLAFAATVTRKEALPSEAAACSARSAPLQSAEPKRRTRAAGSADAESTGAICGLGEAGEVPVRAGASGAMSSCS